MKKFHLLALLFSLNQIVCYSQSFRFYLYTTEQGLPTNLIKTVQADKEGYIWLGSDAGVARFDGKRFLTFKKEFPNPYIKGLTLSKQGKMFVVNDMGLFEAQGTAFSLVLDGSNAPELNKLNYPKDLVESTTGEHWISEPQSIVKYKDGKLKRYVFADRFRTQNFSNSFQIVEHKQKIYAIAFTGEFFAYSPNKDDFEQIPLSTKNPTHAIAQLNEDDFLVGTSEGIFKVNFNTLNLKKLVEGIDVSSLGILNRQLFVGSWTKGLYTVRDFNKGFEVEKIDNLPTKHVNDIFVDREGGIWLACDEGLVLMKKTYFSKVEIPQEDSYVQGIFPISDSELMVTEGSNIWKVGKDVKLIFKTPDGSSLLGAGKIGDLIVAGSLSDKLFAFSKNKVLPVKGHTRGVAFNFHLDNKDHLWVCRYGNEDIVYKIDSKGNLKPYSKGEGINGRTFVVKSTEKYVYIAGEGISSYLYKYSHEKDVIENISLPLKVPQFLVHDMYVENDSNIYLAANEGLYLHQKDSISKIETSVINDEQIKSIYPALGGGLWLGTNLGLFRYLNGGLMLFDEKDGLPTRTITYRATYQDPSGRIWVATANGLAVAKIEDTSIPKTISPIFFSIKAEGKEIAENNKKYEYGTDWEFAFATLSYPNQFAKYQFRANGGSWNDLSENRLFLNRLHWGKYQIEIRALQPGNYTWSDPLSFVFEIEKPWYFSVWFIVLIILGLILLGILFAEIYSYRIRLQKLELEKIVKLRTQEVIYQNDQILQQKLEIEKQTEKIKSSISTASRIQRAVLPPKSKIDNIFVEHFVIYLPKDVVSGDFYWVNQVEDCKIVVVADCTGHGVPGALMSMIGITLLDECILGKNILSPEKILEYLDQRLVAALRYEGSMSIEGMDMVVCCIKGDILEFAGAKRPALVMRKNGDIIKLQGITRPLGGFTPQRVKPFSKETMSLSKGDTLYLFSDGITDQFGGMNRSKFAIKGISAVLSAFHSESLDVQREQLLKQWNQWKDKNKILDDILVLAVKF